MADDPLSDVLNIFAAPLAGTIRSVEQFRTGVDEFLRGVENFNRTMENLNETAERINVLLAEVEEPLRAAIPQVTRTVRVADEVTQVVSGPLIAVAPGLTRLADTLNNPAFVQLPNQLAQFSDVLNELTRRLGPLTQVAGAAGGLLGGLRFPGVSSSSMTDDDDDDDIDDDDDAGLTVRRTASRSSKAASESTSTAGSSSKERTAKQSTAKRSATKAKKATAKKKSSSKKTSATRSS